MKIKTADLIGAPLDWAVAQCEGFLEGDVFGRGCVKDTGFYKKNKHGGFEPMLLQSTHDKWVRQCETYPWGRDQVIWRPSVDWSQGGPIIQKEGIELMCGLTEDMAARFKSANPHWSAFPFGRPDVRNKRYLGPTPLIAACRCFVASRFGDEVDIPEELLT